MVISNKCQNQHSKVREVQKLSKLSAQPSKAKDQPRKIYIIKRQI